MKKYVAAALVLLITFTLIGTVNRLPLQLYSTSNSSVESVEQLLSNFNLTPPNIPNETSMPSAAQPLDLRENLYHLRNLNPNSVVMMVAGATHTSYLRDGVYATYRDGEWYPLRMNLTSVVSVFRPSKPYSSIEDNISVKLMRPLEKGFLYTSLYTFSVNGVEVLYSPETNLFYAGKPTTQYSFTTVHYYFSNLTLLDASVPSGGEFSKYLEVPQNISPKIVELAHNITWSYASPYQKALAIERYLKTHYVYNLNATPAPKGVDPVYWFLFDSKEGVCLDFNSAFVILARLSGLPARLVVGFKIKPTSNPQMVYMRQAHAWAEVYFNGLGWVTFDATPSPRQPLKTQNTTNVTPVKPHIVVRPNPVVVMVNQRANVDVAVITGAEDCNLTSLIISLPGKFEVGKKGAPGFSLPTGIFLNFTLPGISTPGTYYPTVRAVLNCSGKKLNVSARFKLLVTGAPFRIIVPKNITAKWDSWVYFPVKVVSNNTMFVGLNLQAPAGYAMGRSWGWTPFTIMVGVFAPPLVGDYLVNITGEGDGYTTVAQTVLRVVTNTSTQITEVPKTITTGVPFTVGGTVFGDNGQPAVGTVVITLNESKDVKGVVIGRGSVTEGKFAINCTVPDSLPPGNYVIIAHYLGNEFFMPSNSDPLVTVKERTILRVPPIVVSRPGNVTISGRLYLANGTPLSGKKVDVYLIAPRYRFLSAPTTDPNGYFTFSTNLTRLGSYELLLQYLGDSKTSKVEKAVTVRVVELNVTMPTKWIVFRKVHINGTLSGTTGGNVTIGLPWGAVSVPVVNGDFSTEFNVTVKPGRYTVPFAYEGYPLTAYTVTVLSPTRIQVVVSQMRRLSRETVKVRLTDVFGDPLVKAEVTLHLFGTHRAYTNASGWAVFTVIPTSSGSFKGVVEFNGDSFNLPAEREFEVNVVGVSSFLWLLLLVPLSGIASLVYKKRERFGKAIAGIQGKKRKLLLLNREPPVYGIGESIVVTARQEVELVVDGKPVGRGRRFELSLPKGLHVIEVRGTGEKVNVRVVDFREEVMRLYDECFLKYAGGFVGVKDLTPEEIAKSLAEKFPKKAGAIKRLTWIFEVAKYSLYELGREDFLEFYRNLREVIGGDCYGKEG
ncbi:transglutaminase domain-containing protein [Thermococcus sp.]